MLRGDLIPPRTRFIMPGMTIRVRDDATLRAIGRRVKRARTRRRLSQEDVAIELRMRLPRSNKATGSIISRIELGTVEAGVDTMAALAIVLGQPLTELAPEYVDDALRLRDVIDLVCAPIDAPISVWILAHEEIWVQPELDFSDQAEVEEVPVIAPPVRRLALVSSL